MASSALQNRIEHLLAYSSQLIFLEQAQKGGQENPISDFSADFQDDLELSLILASSKTTEQQYREDISKQLLGANGHYNPNQPIKAIYSSLLELQSNVLIHIQQAQYLPKSIIQELWHLIQQSRSAETPYHISVLLSGESKWLDKANTWFSAQAVNKPVFLRPKPVEYPEKSMVAIDTATLLAEHRAEFTKRMAGRDQQPDMPMHRNRSITLLGIGISSFVIIFSAILWAVNPQLFEQIIPHQADDNTHTTLVSDISAVSPEQVLLVSHALDYDAQLEDEQSNPTRVSNDNAQFESAREQSLVRTWAQASERITRLSQSPQETPIETSASGVTEQTNSQPLTPNKNTATQTIEPVLVTHKNEQVSPDELAQPYNNSFLVSISEPEFVLQVAAMADASAMQEFIDEHQLQDKLWIYQTSRNQQPWYVLLHQQRYPSIETARQDISNLPTVLKVGEPFVKSLKQIHKELKSRA